MVVVTISIVLMVVCVAAFSFQVLSYRKAQAQKDRWH
jgi:hypothetical protein